LIRLLLVRHGVTEWNQAGRYQGHHDISLTDLGREQARQLGVRLTSEDIDAVYSSDLSRARETASLAMQARDALPIFETPALREMSFGAWEGLRHDEVARKFPDDWSAWVRDQISARPSGGESLGDLRSRLADFYQSVAPPPKVKGEPRDWFTYRAAGQAVNSEDSRTLLVVTHGGPVRVLLTLLLDIPIERYWRFSVRPASLTIFDVHPEGAIAEVIGDTSHLG